MIEVPHVCFEQTIELLFMQDEKVIQAFSPHALQKAFADGIRAVRVRYGVRSTLMPLVVATCAKLCPNLLSLSRSRYFGLCPYGVASRSCCATQGSVGERVTFTWITFRDCNSMMKNAKNGRKKRSVTWRRITGPHLCRMIAQERSPVLSSRPCGANVPHILLNSSFRHPNIQLEQLATNALSSPEAVVYCHLLNQSDRLGREPRLSRVRLRCALR